jgi:hypothetical protein
LSASVAPVVPPGDRAVGRDGHSLRLEPRLAEAVRSDAALGGVDIDRPIDGVELAQVRQALLGKLHRRNRADRRDELAGRRLGGFQLVPLHHIRQRKDVLQQDVPPGRFPRTMWSCARSAQDRGVALEVHTLTPRGVAALLPTAVNRPFWISARETTRFEPSIV